MNYAIVGCGLIGKKRLAGLPAGSVHAPWEAPAEELAAAGVKLGSSYPRPIVDHAEARQAALAAFQRMRS